MKGSASNLGAERLSEICLQAEKEASQDKKVKEELLTQILMSYDDVVRSFSVHKSLGIH